MARVLITAKEHKNSYENPMQLEDPSIPLAIASGLGGVAGPLRVPGIGPHVVTGADQGALDDPGD